VTACAHRQRQQQQRTATAVAAATAATAAAAATPTSWAQPGAKSLAVDSPSATSAALVQTIVPETSLFVRAVLLPEAKTSNKKNHGQQQHDQHRR